MKSYAIVTVLTAVMVVSTVTAQDTLRVQSLRSVDLCSGTRRWLIAVSVGTIRFSDSLESFDITIGFNRRVLRPTDVLKEGTLSAQMSNGPTLNAITPGEMRIFGFNIARSVSGDAPLVAVAGDFIGSCHDKGDLSLPYAPDFNGEFRRRFTFSVVDSIATFLKKKLVGNVGCTFEADTVNISSDKASAFGTLRVKRSESGDSTGWINLTYVKALGGLTVGDITGLNCQIDSVLYNKSGVSVLFRKTLSDPSDPLLMVEARRGDSTVEQILDIEATLVSDDCECSVPGLRDTLFVRTTKPIVGVKSSCDDGACTIEVNDDYVVGKCHHHEMKILEVNDLLGHNIKSYQKHEDRAIELSIAELPAGIYFAVMRCGGTISMKTIVK